MCCGAGAEYKGIWTIFRDILVYIFSFLLDSVSSVNELQSQMLILDELKGVLVPY